MGLPNIAEAKVLVVPVPYEKKVAYKVGTRNGPEAILRASNELYLYDEILETEAYQKGINTLKPATNLKDLEKLPTDKFVIGLGGEHTISLPLIKRFDQKDLSILHIDAHADMKDEFDGSRMSHVCVMRRVSEFNKNIVQVGVRGLDKDELDYMKEKKIKTFFAHKKFDIKEIVKNLKKNVYVSIDLDAFDPSVFPDVGTPEPNGLTWKQVNDLLMEVFSKRNVVGCDVVELCPNANSQLSDYSAAKLVYRIVGLKDKFVKDT